MDQKKFDELTDLLAQDLKTEKDVSAMTRMLSKFAMEKALEIEMEEHLGEKREGRRDSGNSRNGYTQKTSKN